MFLVTVRLDHTMTIRKHSLLNGDKSFVFSYRPKQLPKIIQFHQNRRR